METYSRLWSVIVVNKGYTFTTCVWRDTWQGAERFVKMMYPYADVVHAEVKS